MKPSFKTSLLTFLFESVVYAVLVVGYYFGVLHFLGDWLLHMFQTERRVYAGMALGLIIAQGILLEFLTRLLLGFIQTLREGK
jgi:hypothetical protein